MVFMVLSIIASVCVIVGCSCVSCSYIFEQQELSTRKDKSIDQAPGFSANFWPSATHGRPRMPRERTRSEKRQAKLKVSPGDQL